MNSPILLLFLLSFGCSNVFVVAYGNNRIDTEHSSISGEFVTYTTNNHDSHIKVLSNALNNTSESREITVKNFVGDGYGTPSQRPTIDSYTVYKSLFSVDALPAVFDDMDKDKIEQIRQYSDNLHKLKLIVNDADKPISIGNHNHIYFWGADRLPNQTGCAQYTASNDPNGVLFCMPEEMDKCAAPISIFPHLALFVLETASGERLAHFTWLCKKGSVCCAWECCEPVPKRERLYALLFIPLFFGIVSSPMIVMCVHSKIRERKINKQVEAQELLQFPVSLQVPLPKSTTKKTITRHSSGSGEYVDFTTSDSSEVITLRSSSIGNESMTIEVRMFRGDGHGMNRRRPTITSSTVYQSLFSLDALPGVFEGMDGERIELVRHYSDNLHKLKLTVKDAGRPITIGDGVQTYFWGRERLPKLDVEHECAEYLTANDNHKVEICKYKKMDKCAVPVSAFPHLEHFVLESTSGERLSEFAWICHGGSVCCAWECCDLYDPDTTGVKIFAFGMLAFLSFGLLLLLREGWKKYVSEMHTKSTSSTLNERSPRRNYFCPHNDKFDECL